MNNNSPSGNNNPSQPNEDTPNRSNPNRLHRAEAGIFERFMDSFLGSTRSRSSRSRSNRIGPSPLGTDRTEAPRSTRSEDTRPDTGGETSRSDPARSEASAPRTSEGTRSEGGASRTSEAASSSRHVPSGGLSERLSERSSDYDDTRAIIITVNYVFSDENDPQNPNRAGSLIMSLPNNSSNRDPRVMQEFIRLATQMAYSTIYNGLHKEKGITVKKFESFPRVSEDELGESSNCSICFEKFDKVEDDDDDETVCSKKRSTCKGPQTTESQNNSRESSSTPRSTPENSNPTNNREREQYLVDYQGNFDHSPIKMPCNHIFGKDCLCEWLKQHTTCPLCRASVAEPRSTQDTTRSSIINIPGLENMSNTALNLVNEPSSESNNSARSSQRSDGIDSDVDESNSALSYTLNYLNRQRNGLIPSEPLFPVGLMSRNTDQGIVTRSTDDVNEDVLDFMNLRNLVPRNTNPENDLSNSENTENTNTENNNENNLESLD